MLNVDNYKITKKLCLWQFDLKLSVYVHSLTKVGVTTDNIRYWCEYEHPITQNFEIRIYLDTIERGQQ